MSKNRTDWQNSTKETKVRIGLKCHRRRRRGRRRRRRRRRKEEEDDERGLQF
jgi:hypothetical protein